MRELMGVLEITLPSWKGTDQVSALLCTKMTILLGLNPDPDDSERI